MKSWKVILVCGWIFAVVLFLAAWDHASAADVGVSWKASEGATGYILEASTDNGLTWATSIDVGAVQAVDYISGENHLLLCSYTWAGLPDTGLVLVRVTAYNAYGATINTSSGAWFNKAWVSPPAATGIGVQ